VCGRYSIRVDAATLAQRFGLEMEQLPTLTPRYNAAPTQQLPVVTQDETRHLELMRWGLIPRWAKDESIGARMINARAETLMEKPSFRPLLRARRCLVVASGFYEWQKPTRTPHYIRASDESLLTFAGLYDIWRDRDGNSVASYAIVTTTPNELMAPIHDRMPVILPPEEATMWLDPDARESEPLLALLRPYPAERMAAYPVSRLVNDPRHEGAHLVERAVA
jgi:putative SOS response-associated peptidase YedK